MRARDLYDHAFLVRARFPFFADLVVLAGSLYPIPSRTRPLNSPAPMVLSLKAWKSRSLPGLPKTEISSHDDRYEKALADPRHDRGLSCGAAVCHRDLFVPEPVE